MSSTADQSRKKFQALIVSFIVGLIVAWIAHQLVLASSPGPGIGTGLYTYASPIAAAAGLIGFIAAYSYGKTEFFGLKTTTGSDEVIAYITIPADNIQSYPVKSEESLATAEKLFEEIRVRVHKKTKKPLVAD